MDEIDVNDLIDENVEESSENVMEEYEFEGPIIPFPENPRKRRRLNNGGEIVTC